ncbi:MAG: tetratricopeptide repeat protein [Gammaproteobacteria bacterium]
MALLVHAVEPGATHERPDPDPVPAPAAAHSERPAARPIEGPGAAVQALLERARQLAQAGKGEHAALALERALRIAPSNGWLWHRLAALRLQQGYPREAAELAKRSNIVAGGNASLTSGNRRLIDLALSRLRQ